MDIRLNLRNLDTPQDILRLTTILSEMADSLDVLYTETAPNGTISARQGRIAMYKNGDTYEVWQNTTGSTAWQRIDKDGIAVTDEKVKASSDDPTADYLDGKVAKSIVIASEKLELSGDAASPGNNKAYATDGSGVKGWRDFPTDVDTNTSNVVFSFSGCSQLGTNSGKVVSDTSIPPTGTPTYVYDYWGSKVANNATHPILIASKFTKISGISTITVYFQVCSSNAAKAVNARADIGTANGNVSTAANHNTLQWISVAIDVSSLTNGTVYDVSIGIRNGTDTANTPMALYSVIGIAS